MSKLRNVISFEVLRNVRKKAFWFAAIVPPVLILVIYGISYLSSQSANNASRQQSAATTKNSKIAVLDETGVISRQTLAKAHVTTEPTRQTGISAVKNGTLSAFIYYPKDVAQAGIQIYARDQGITNAMPYDGLATALLVDSAKVKVITAIRDPQVVSLLEKAPGVTSTTYKNGKQTNDEATIIAPGVFLAAFLALVVLQAYLMITSTTEEKENRTAEMLLTSIKSRSLITGKILSIFILGLVQLLVIIVPLFVAYALFKQHITLPGGVTLSHIPLDPKAITFGVLFFVGGFAMFTGFLVGLGSLFPSAQDAGRYMGFGIISAYIPIYAIGYILSPTPTLIVNIFTFFPLTAPTTVLIRNAIGTISTSEVLAALAVVLISAVLAMAFAVKAFRYGAMEYGRRVSVKELFH